eukprot:1152962-Pelagomonas_calceolata.AAC.10
MPPALAVEIDDLDIDLPGDDDEDGAQVRKERWNPALALLGLGHASRICTRTASSRITATSNPEAKSIPAYSHRHSNLLQFLLLGLHPVPPPAAAPESLHGARLQLAPCPFLPPCNHPLPILICDYHHHHRHHHHHRRRRRYDYQMPHTCTHRPD